MEFRIQGFSMSASYNGKVEAFNKGMVATQEAITQAQEQARAVQQNPESTFGELQQSRDMLQKAEMEANTTQRKLCEDAQKWQGKLQSELKNAMVKETAGTGCC